MKKWLLAALLIACMGGIAYGVTTLDDDVPADSALISTYAGYLRETREKLNELITDVTVGAWSYVTITHNLASGEKLLIDTSSAPATVTLPTTATQGDWALFTDAKGTWGSNAVTVDRNGHKIAGLASNLTLTSSLPVYIVYMDASYGWAYASWTPAIPGTIGGTTPGRGIFSSLKDTGLVSASPVFTASDGNFTATGTVGIAKGGTGAVTAGAALIALGGEATANKSTGTSLGTSDTLFPTQNAVKTYVDTADALKENTANKSNSSALGTSATLFPTQNATKVYVDSAIATSAALKENTANKSTDTNLGTSDTLFPTQNAVKTYVNSVVATGFLVDFAGLETSNAADGDHDISIASGGAADSTGSYYISLTSAITKRIDATWAAGTANGGLSTGSVAINTWYFVHVIKNLTTDAVDALFDTSYTAPTLPAGYTIFRCVGVVKTDGSANIYPFRQYGEYFYWIDDKTDLAGTAATDWTPVILSVPSMSGAPIGYQKIIALIYTTINHATLSSVCTASWSDSAATGNYIGIAGIGGSYNALQSHVMVGVGGTVNYKCTEASTGISIRTQGFIFPLKRR